MSHRVLVVDDSSSMRSVIKVFLAGFGFEFDEAADGAAALAAVQRALPDLVLLDQHLPEEDGVEVLHRLRGSDSGKQRTMPVVMLTAERSATFEAEVRQLGVEAVLHKPFTADGLRAVVRRVLSL